MSRPSHWRGLAGAAITAAALLGGATATAQGAEPNLVVMDNDFAGPGGTDIQAILPLIRDPALSVLGFTVVTGDGWENDESARLRRFLEIAGRADIPVADGAAYPLLRTVAEMRAWERRFGRIPWKGAWGGLGVIDAVAPLEPPLPKFEEGLPSSDPAPERAAEFLIRQVHAHPHQVTVVAAGPLTNLALAVRMDPTFAEDAKQLIFMGGLVDTGMASVTGHADFASDFNLIFDPEAAHITLTARWPKITAVGDVSNSVMMDRPLMDRIATAGTPVTAYLSRYFVALPLWDEMAAAIAADPSLVTSAVDVVMDVDVSGGPGYGRAQIWSDAFAPKDMGLRTVTLVQTIDKARFLDQFVKAAQTPPTR